MMELQKRKRTVDDAYMTSEEVFEYLLIILIVFWAVMIALYNIGWFGFL